MSENNQKAGQSWGWTLFVAPLITLSIVGICNGLFAPPADAPKHYPPEGVRRVCAVQIHAIGLPDTCIPSP